MPGLIEGIEARESAYAERLRAHAPQAAGEDLGLGRRQRLMRSVIEEAIAAHLQDELDWLASLRSRIEECLQLDLDEGVAGAEEGDGETRAA